MKRALIIFCIAWTAITILLIACSPLLRLFAISRCREDIERVHAGLEPRHASKAGQMISGLIAERPIFYDCYKGFGYYINVFHLGKPLNGSAPQQIDVLSFSGTIVGPAFPLTIFDDSSSYPPSYDSPGRQP